MSYGMSFDSSSQFLANQQTEDQSQEVGMAGQEVARNKQLAVFKQKLTDTRLEVDGAMINSIDKVSFR